MDEMTMMVVGLFAVIGFVLLLLLGVIVYVLAFHVNWKPPKVCPHCGAPLDRFLRGSTSRRQKVMGGWTCGSCGAELDKWGKILWAPEKDDVTERLERESRKRDVPKPPPGIRRGGKGGKAPGA